MVRLYPIPAAILNLRKKTRNILRIIMKQPSLKKNFVLNTIYQILIIVIPFISMPYISRVLGAGGVGTYSYTYSIQTYFAMFAALGTVTYGTREIARVRENEEERSRLFWEIELLTVLTSLACLILWGIWILFNHEYRMCYVILTINIIVYLIAQLVYIFDF